MSINLHISENYCNFAENKTDMQVFIFIIVLFIVWRTAYAFIKTIDEYGGCSINVFGTEMLSIFCVAVFTGPVGVWFYKDSDMNPILFIVLFILGFLALVFGGPIVLAI